MVFPSSRFLTLVLALALVAPLSTLADTPAVDAEEQIDNGLKEFGYLAGLSRGCVARAQEGDLEREVLDLHGTIGRLLGTDRAFLFAAAFGYGSCLQIPTEECSAVLNRYAAQAQSLRTKTGDRP
jgi:hypothetical protein